MSLAYKAMLSEEFSVERFTTEGEMEDYITREDYDEETPGLCAGIVIEGAEGNYNIKLRFDDNDELNDEDKKQQVPNTNNPVVNSHSNRPDEDSYMMYYTSGFTYLEYLVTTILLDNNKLSVWMIPMETAEYVKDMFLSSAGQFLSFIVILCYLAPVFRIVSMIVQDKELKTREGMNMMGLKDSAYWLSFVVYYAVIFLVLGFLLSIITVLFIFKKSNWFLTFLFFFLFGLSVFSFGFCLSTLFYRPRVASITATMLYFASTLIKDLVDSETTSEVTKNTASLLPTVASGLGIVVYVDYETGQYGLSFSNVTDLSNNYRFSSALIMLAVDIILYGLIGIYLDNVISNQNGVSKPFYYFLTKDYWTGGISQTDDVSKADLYANEDDILYPDEHFEKVREELKAQEVSDECLKIRCLNKFFGSKHSVADFSVNMYKSQIFALLGPNGAGKTTTISMLSGLLPASSGTSFFNGITMFEEMSKLREKLGVCPQHDVLFEFLTPKEHLEIFAAFKGRDGTEAINKDVEEILQDIELNDSANVKACNLSGGQRRKLSIGISFIGNSDMIFLDEPTSGIDIAARKRVWAMLKKYKRNKVIILTTHYMEEAEELGDRIGIMTSGKLRCVGSPLFLKTVYGAGYNLVIAHEDSDRSELIKENIINFIKTFVQGVRIRREVGKEVTYFLPKDQAKCFKEFFVELDKNLDNLKIVSYGMATNTLEEIFLRVAREDDTHGQKLNRDMLSCSIVKSYTGQNQEQSKLDTYSIMNEPEKSFYQNFIIHFSAIFLKRIYINYRNISTIINEILVPIILIVFGFALTKMTADSDSKPRWFDIGIYKTPQSIIVNKYLPSGVDVDTESFTKYFEPEMKVLTSDIKELEPFYAEVFNLRDVSPYRYGSIYISSLQNDNIDFAIFVNMSSQDAAGAFMGYFCQTFARFIKNDDNYKLKFATAPFPLTYKAKNQQQARNGNIVSNTLVIAFALVPASIISFIVQEREANLKHQQLISGVSLTAYWLSNGAMDIFKSLLPCSVAIIMIYAFSFVLPCAWLLIFIYGFSIIPFTYAMSFMFEKENVAQTSVLLFNFFTGVVLSPVFTILRMFDNTKMIAKVLCWLFRFFPTFSLAYGINNISYKKIFAAIERKTAAGDLSLEVAGGDLAFLMLAFPFYTLLIFMAEAQYFNFLVRYCEPKKTDDKPILTRKHELVISEEKACELMQLDNNPPAILTKHLKKIYRVSATTSTLAVNDLSFYVNKGECLALLGTNGAGKTTTFKMVTKDILPSLGQVFINGMELTSNFTKIRKMIGYGPQYESGYMLLTVRENLEFYAKLKGIPLDIRESMLVKLIDEMDLKQYEHIQVGKLSGGNKRKTTAAIALLGNPPIVLLDELSTGVDPQAKRFMWHVIQKISTKNKNTAVILTTHSMEEAEYLCTKMAIMVSGDFCCIGTPQELKDAFGKGFEIQISIPLPSEDEEEKHMAKFGLSLNTKLNHEEVLNLFKKTNQEKLEEQLTSKGNAAHILAELNTCKVVNAKLVANFLVIQERALEIAQELANEFGEVRVPEHIGNFFKFRVDKSNPRHTIGFLFGMLQDIVERYNITQYSASQTSLNQIFQTFAKQAEVFSMI